MMVSDLSTKIQAVSSRSSRVNVSSRSRRFFAYALDQLIIGLFYSILGITTFFGAGYTTKILWYLIPLAYFTLFPINSWWATPGQKLLGIYVCRADNSEQISFSASLARFIIFKSIVLVSVVLTLLLGFGSFKNATQQFSNLQNHSYQDISQSKNTNQADDDEGYIESDVFKTEKPLNNNQMDAQVYEVSYLQTITCNTHNYQYGLQFNQSPQQQAELFKIFTHLMFVYLIIHSILVVGPTFFGNKKQTIYDVICNTCVLQRPAP
jgi:hypothetical protein